MNDLLRKPTERDLVLQSRTLEALTSLVRSLGTTADVAGVARQSLLVICGQLLLQRAALYLWDSEIEAYSLCEVVGLQAGRIAGKDRWLGGSRWSAAGVSQSITDLGSDEAAEPQLSEYFVQCAPIRDGDDRIGLVLLGPPIGADRLEGEDRRFEAAQLLMTMGIAIGAAIRRALAFEDLRRAKARVEELDRVRQTTLRHVNHEFRTPLSVALSAAALAREIEPAELPDVLDLLEDSLHRLDHLIMSVLQNFEEQAEIGADMQPFQDEAFESKIIGPAIAGMHDPAVRIVRGDFGPPSLRAVHEEHACFILGALLRNALLYGAKTGGWIAVHRLNVDLDWYDSQDQMGRIPLYRQALDDCDQVCLEPLFLPENEPAPIASPRRPVTVVEVVDAGIGIPKADLESIFEPFSQATNCPDREVRGAGLSLASARHLAEHQDGELRVYSEEGVGSIFAWIVPVIARGVDAG